MPDLIQRIKALFRKPEPVAPAAAAEAEPVDPPAAEAAARATEQPSAEPKPLRLDFDQIYRDNVFGSDESHSGEGSEMSQTEILRRELPGIFRKLGVASLLDLPCGDFNWMGHVDLDGIHYIGGDVVKDIVEKNIQRHSAPGREFLHLDLIRSDLPRCDLVFARDVLVHLNYEDIAAAIENIRRSGATWLATTTFTRRHTNMDLFGVWRPLNLADPPFSFPEPELVLEEGCPPVQDLDFSDKSIAIWRVAGLPAVAVETA